MPLTGCVHISFDSLTSFKHADLKQFILSLAFVRPLVDANLRFVSGDSPRDCHCMCFEAIAI